jgi:hypothetical protein
MSLTLQDVESRIKDLEQSISRSLANHNALLGMLEEAKFFLRSMTKVEDIIAPPPPGHTNILDEANNIIESFTDSGNNPQ